MTKPVFIPLHGAWHSPRCWTHVVTLFDQSGYSSVVLSLPSTSSSPPTPVWSQEIHTIRTTVSELIPERDVDVVLHSFSGITGGTALEGLDRAPAHPKG